MIKAPAELELQFDEESHRYTLVRDPGLGLTSVTTMLNQYHEPFDAKRHAKAYAAKHGKKTEDVLFGWHQKGEVARLIGHLLHAYAEELAVKIDCNKSLPVECDAPERVAGYAKGVLDWYHARPEIMYGRLWAELPVVYPEYGLAGTVDLIATNLEGFRAIVDFKTSKEIKLFGSSLLYQPLSMLPDTNFWHYTMQLNLYATILRAKYDFDAELLRIVWVSSTGLHEEIYVPILEDRTAELLEHWNESRAQHH